MCVLAGHPNYVWYKNGQHAGKGMTYSHIDRNIDTGDSFSCAVEGYERFHSPLVCKSTPQYTDMLPDVMDLLVKTITHYAL